MLSALFNSIAPYELIQKKLIQFQPDLSHYSVDKLGIRSFPFNRGILTHIVKYLTLLINLLQTWLPFSNKKEETIEFTEDFRLHPVLSKGNKMDGHMLEIFIFSSKYWERVELLGFLEQSQ